MAKLATREDQAADKRRRQAYRERGLSQSQIDQLEAARRERQRQRSEGAAPASLTATTGELAPVDVGSQTEAPSRDEELIEEFEQNLAEEQIELREEVLEESGGSSRATEVIGDEEGEEITTVSNTVLVGFKRNFTSDGFYQSLSSVFGNLEDERVREKAKSRSNNSVLIGRTNLRGGRVGLQDYRAISRLSELKVELRTREVVYSNAEKNGIVSRIGSDKLSKKQALESVEQFLNVTAQEEVEGSIIVNKIESKKRIKLSSVSETLPQPPAAPTSSGRMREPMTQDGELDAVPTGVSEEVTRTGEVRRISTLAPGLRDNFEPPRGTY